MGSGDGLGGCHACIKYLMFAFNFVFWLIGCAMVGFGIWLLVDDEFQQKLENVEYLEYLRYAGIGIIVVGGIVMIVGFFGCCGAIRESQCLLVMFFICMLLLFLALVGGGVAVIVYQSEVIDAAKKVFSDAVKKYNDENVWNGYIDAVQDLFKCCGSNGPIDYAGKPLPDSCGSYVVGCIDAIERDIKSNSTLFAGVAIGAGALMLLGMIFSMLLCCAIRDLE